MATLNIVKDGDPILRKTSRDITEFSPRIFTLIDDMWETMAKAGGVGLAAVQVGVLKKICVIDTGNYQLELINPVIIKKSGEKEELEGCLSCPGQWGIVKRPAKVTVRTLTRDGKEKTYTADGLLCKAICHEVDHLYGKLFYDNAVRMLSEEEIRKLEEKD